MEHRKDPLEAAARALAIKDNKDPDTRIALPAGSKRPLDARGQPRTRPLWTDYRAQAAAHQKAAPYQGATHQHIHNIPTTIVGNHETNTIEQLTACLQHGDIIAASLCADGHKAYFQPVGSSIAYRNHTSISGVGPDIACGNAAIQLDIKYNDVAHLIPTMLENIHRTISFGVERHSDLNYTTSILDDHDALRAAGVQQINKRIRDQFGTIGGGNHYADLFTDAEGYIWIGVHFGSRGLGAYIFRQYSKWSGAHEDIHSPKNILQLDSEIGQRYHAAMTLAGTYAWEGRLYVLEQIRRIIGGGIQQTIHNYHNYAFTETHNDIPVTVVRKGATPAYPGQYGFIGGSMGDNAVIVRGHNTASPLAQGLIHSTVHGAGRPMSRRDALNQFRPHDMRQWMQDKRIRLFGGTVDESPMAYRRLPEVLQHHASSIDILHTLTPFAVFMAGDNDIDPYKD